MICLAIHVGEKGKPHTIDNIALLDLLEHLGPDGGMALLVLGKILGPELDNLLDALAGVSLLGRVLGRSGPRGTDGRRSLRRGGGGLPELRHCICVCISRVRITRTCMIKKR
jgi:hypothetical protein